MTGARGLAQKRHHPNPPPHRTHTDTHTHTHTHMRAHTKTSLAIAQLHKRAAFVASRKTSLTAAIVVSRLLQRQCSLVRNMQDHQGHPAAATCRTSRIFEQGGHTGCSAAAQGNCKAAIEADCRWCITGRLAGGGTDMRRRRKAAELQYRATAVPQYRQGTGL